MITVRDTTGQYDFTYDVFGGVGTWIHRENCYGTFSNNTCSAGPNNGNVVAIKDYLDASRTQYFSYDKLNRIKQADEGPVGNTSVGRWGQTFTIDAGCPTFDPMNAPNLIQNL